MIGPNILIIDPSRLLAYLSINTENVLGAIEMFREGAGMARAMGLELTTSLEAPSDITLLGPVIAYPSNSSFKPLATVGMLITWTRVIPALAY
jgi:hypothetical protein